MKITEKVPPRKYLVGKNKQISISDCGAISLEPDEQITFITPQDNEYDVTRKNWGYYATPSVNGRLKKFNFKTALVKNDHGMIYIMLVERKKMHEFNIYIQEEKLTVIEWLDEHA